MIENRRLAAFGDYQGTRRISVQRVSRAWEELQMPKEPVHKEMEGHFHACESCDYDGGFHVTFKKTDKSKSYLIVLMCPLCKQTYDIDWQIKTQ